MKKCFISIPIPNASDFSERLHELKQQTDVRYSIVQPRNYHFTLHFFGPRNSEEIETIQKLLSEISFEPFIVKLTDLATLPSNPKKARVLIVKPEMGYENVRQLGMRIRQELEENGHSIDKRNFVPHLTVGRIKSKGNPEDLVTTWMKNKLESETKHHITRFVLMESIPSPQGSIYKEIKSFPSLNQK